MEHTNGYTLAPPMTPPIPTQKRYMNVKECADYCGIGRHTIYRYAKNEQIPYIAHGRAKRFDRIKIDQWLEARTIEAKI